ncbi:MAG: beta-N-acetylhexosaminidase [bacterium]|nr:beta-N-acetylhexosaminidase [bacterium]
MSEDLEYLKKLVGSLLIVGFDGPRLTASCRNYLEQWDLGGVILFKRNIQSLEQVASLNTLIEETAAVPPVISVDHEGGKVFRLPEPFTPFPPMRGVGDKFLKDRNPELAEEVGRAMGRELRAAGFNLDYAPVLDVNSNPSNPIIGERAFGSDPQEVAELGAAFLEGLEEVGVLGCGKHFPGHGDTFEDSHETLPKVDKSRMDLNACELIPFKEAVARQFPMIMTAHVLYPQLDKDWPATLSEKILTGILREEFAYEGLIVSDDLFMKGILEHWSLVEAAERFLRVGGDMVLLCHKEEAQRRVAAHLVHLAEKDHEFRDALEIKRKRVEALRQRLTLGAQPELLARYQSDHQELIKKIS